MADLTPIVGSDYMAAQLPAEFAGKANIEALWQSFGDLVTLIENAAAWVQTAFAIDTAAGVQLDALGELLGQPRLGGPYGTGETDAAYRPKLRAAVLRNRSKCTAGDLSAMVAALLGTKIVGIQVADFPPAGFKLAVYVTAALTSGEADALVSYCVAAKAAGVALLGLAWYTAPVFGFVPSTNPPVQGYGDGNPAHPGGAWANYIYP